MSGLANETVVITRRPYAITDGAIAAIIVMWSVVLVLLILWLVIYCSRYKKEKSSFNRGLAADDSIVGDIYDVEIGSNQWNMKRN